MTYDVIFGAKNVLQWSFRNTKNVLFSLKRSTEINFKDLMTKSIDQVSQLAYA